MFKTIRKDLLFFSFLSHDDPQYRDPFFPFFQIFCIYCIVLISYFRTIEMRLEKSLMLTIIQYMALFMAKCFWYFLFFFKERGGKALEGKRNRTRLGENLFRLPAVPACACLQVKCWAIMERNARYPSFTDISVCAAFLFEMNTGYDVLLLFYHGTVIKWGRTGPTRQTFTDTGAGANDEIRCQINPCLVTFPEKSLPSEKPGSVSFLGIFTREALIWEENVSKAKSTSNHLVWRRMNLSCMLEYETVTLSELLFLVYSYRGNVEIYECVKMSHPQKFPETFK